MSKKQKNRGYIRVVRLCEGQRNLDKVSGSLEGRDLMTFYIVDNVPTLHEVKGELTYKANHTKPRLVGENGLDWGGQYFTDKSKAIKALIKKLEKKRDHHGKEADKHLAEERRFRKIISQCKEILYDISWNRFW